MLSFHDAWKLYNEDKGLREAFKIAADKGTNDAIVRSDGGHDVVTLRRLSAKLIVNCQTYKEFLTYLETEYAIMRCREAGSVEAT